MAGEVRMLELPTPVRQWLSRLQGTGSPGAHHTRRLGPPTEVFIEQGRSGVQATVSLAGSNMLLWVVSGDPRKQKCWRDLFSETCSATPHQGVKKVPGGGRAASFKGSRWPSSLSGR